jgi:hypothetical protein
MKGVAVLAAAVTVALLVGTAASSAARSGLHGRVCRGPLPVDTGAPRTCATPQSLVFYLSRLGRRYVVRSAANGTYAVALPAGYYRAQLPVHVGITPGMLRPTVVHVRSGHDDRLDFYLQRRAAAGPPK